MKKLILTLNIILISIMLFAQKSGYPSIDVIEINYHLTSKFSAGIIPDVYKGETITLGVNLGCGVYAQATTNYIMLFPEMTYLQTFTFAQVALLPTYTTYNMDEFPNGHQLYIITITIPLNPQWIGPHWLYTIDDGNGNSAEINILNSTNIDENMINYDKIKPIYYDLLGKEEKNPINNTFYIRKIGDKIDKIFFKCS
jgi:hypothetical protein